MARPILVLAVLFVLVAFGSYALFSSGERVAPGAIDLGGAFEEPSPRGGAPVVPLDGGAPAEADAEAGRRPAPSSAAPAGAEEPIEDARRGALLARIRGRDGVVPAAVGAAIHPLSGDLVASEDGVAEIVRLAPGAYTLKVWAEGYVHQVRPDVVINAGRRLVLDFVLEPGIVPAGRVIDETDHAGIEGAIVELTGGLRVQTGPGGRFEAPYAVPKGALREVFVGHRDYDRNVHELEGQDPRDLVIGLTRGTAVVRGSLRNGTGRPWPERALVELLRHHTGGRLIAKREVAVRPEEGYELRGIHDGLYRVKVSFPGERFGERHRDITVARGESLTVDIDFEAGGVIEGRLVARGAEVAGRKVELIGGDGRAVAEATTDGGGAFTILDVKPGSYRAKVWVGAPCFTTEELRVEAKATVALTIDCDAQALKEG